MALSLSDGDEPFSDQECNGRQLQTDSSPIGSMLSTSVRRVDILDWNMCPTASLPFMMFMFWICACLALVPTGLLFPHTARCNICNVLRSPWNFHTFVSTFSSGLWRIWGTSKRNPWPHLCVNGWRLIKKERKRKAGTKKTRIYLPICTATSNPKSASWLAPARGTCETSATSMIPTAQGTRRQERAGGLKTRNGESVQWIHVYTYTSHALT